MQPVREDEPVACRFGAPDPTRGPGLNRLQEYTMNMTEMHTKHRLERYGAVALRDARGSTVTSISGTLWLTMEGDSRDIVLEPRRIVRGRARRTHDRGGASGERGGRRRAAANARLAGTLRGFYR